MEQQLTQPKPVIKRDRELFIQTLQYWQLSMQVRRGLNPATLEPVKRPPQDMLQYIDNWLCVLTWSPKLRERILELRVIVEAELDYETNIKTGS